ncbi:MAG: hypothetical protein BGO51_26955 [Rhodospirillales bacterium 69-11]|nr:DUF1186 domain-containing protein [Rhodospirillales bacterium]OJW19022.1 MAG: hypothetical protein BGO51_26955 [Rhodospirillales bacterium 69-11]
MDVATALAALGHVDTFPREALAWTQANWPAMSPHALAMTAAVTEGRDESPEASRALFFLLHAGAAARATELHAPLCMLLLDAELGEEVLSDAVPEHLGSLLTATFDGDTAPLLSLAESASANPFSRGHALLALAWLAEAGHLPRDVVVAALGRIHATLLPEDDALALTWTEVVAALQVTELEQDARGLFTTHIPRGLATWKEFLEDVSDLRRGVTPNPIWDRNQTAPLEDAVAALEEWTFESPTAGTGDDAGKTWLARDSAEPWMNPHRHVGRNDPCPCGSGKKYKKCCLPA